MSDISAGRNVVLGPDGEILYRNVPPATLRGHLERGHVEPTDTEDVYRLIPVPLRPLSPTRSRARARSRARSSQRRRA